jgi:hypothetical protein
MDFQSSINKSKNLINPYNINNENLNIKKDSLLDSTSYSFVNNKKIHSLKQPPKKINNSKISEINTFLINKNTNNGRFPICFSSMTNKQNFNKILSSKFNYKTNLNQKPDYNSIDLSNNESITNKINKNSENDKSFNDENSKMKKLNEINFNLKFFSPKNNSSTINFNINNIFTKKNNFSRNEIKPIMKNLSNYMNTLQMNSFSKDGLSLQNNSSIISNVYMGSPIKLFQNNSMNSIKKKMFNKPQLKLKKNFLSPISNKKREKIPGVKNLNKLFDKKLILDKNFNNSILSNNEYKKEDTNNNKNNEELSREINEILLINKKLNSLEKNVGKRNKKTISRNFNINPISKKEEKKLILTNIVNNKKGILRKNSNITKKNLFLKRNIIPLRRSSSVKIKFNLEKDIANIKNNNNEKDDSKESNLRSEKKNTTNNNSNNSSFINKNPQKIKKHPSLKLNESNKESSSSDEKKNKTFVRRRNRKTMSVKEYYSNMCFGIEDKQKTKIIEKIKKIPFLESYKSPKEINFYEKNKFVSNFINPRAELISLNTEKKIKFFKTKLILKEKLNLLAFEEKIKKQLSNYKFPNSDEIKINFKKNYCPKTENNDNITIIKDNFKVNINKVIYPKINFGLKYKLIKFLLKTVNLTSIYLPYISMPQSNSEHLNNFKLERFHEFKDYFKASKKSKFVEHKYDIVFIEKNFPQGNDVFRRDLFLQEDEDDNKNNYISTNNSFENNTKEEIYHTKGKISNISYEEEKDKLKILSMKSCKELKSLIMNNFSLLKEKTFFANPKKPALGKGKKRILSKDLGIIPGQRHSEKPTIKKLRKIYDAIKLLKKKSMNEELPLDDDDDDDNDNDNGNDNDNDVNKKEDDFFNYLKALLVSGEIDYFNEYFDSISKFININQKDENGNTLLILATSHGHGTIVKNLLEKGVDINEKNNKGNTALHYAISQKYFSLADLLTKFGAKEDIKNIFGLTPLECIGKSVEEYSY